MQEARSRKREARGKRQEARGKRLWAIGVLVGVLASVLTAGIVVAQGETVTDDQVNAVAKKLNCPVCENVPLDVCETQACFQWRDLIRQKLAAGETPEQIVAYFQATYGDRVLQEPPRRGFTALVWVLPFVGLAAGVIILVVALKRMTASPKAVVPEPKPSPVPTDEYRARLEREVREGVRESDC